MCLRGPPVNGCVVGAGGLVEECNRLDMVGVVKQQLHLNWLQETEGQT